MNETVRRFLPMVDFLEQILGKNSEIVLHDFSDPDHAIVDIRNGIVSGRKVGGPATDLALKIMHDAKYRDLPFITGYEGRGAGGKTLESATYFIRENDEIVGMLCVNTDLSTVRSINAMAQQLMACFDAAPTRTEPAPIEVESLSESTQELIDRSIAELLSARGLDVASLGQSELNHIQILNKGCSDTFRQRREHIPGPFCLIACVEHPFYDFTCHILSSLYNHHTIIAYHSLDIAMHS